MSNKLKAVIIEDENAAKEHLIKLINKNFKNNIEVVATAGSVKKGIEIIKKNDPHLLFLDIQLEDGEGFEILDHFSSTSFDVIFTTGLLDQKEKAIDYYAFYYLNKPLEEEKFKTVVTTFLNKRTVFNFEQYLALKQLIDSNHKKIPIAIANGFKNVNIKDIIFCEAEGSYTYIQTIEDNYLSSTNLGKFEDLLENNTFFRIHRSTLLNLNHVSAYSNSGLIELTNGHKVQVSSRNKKNFLRMLKLMN